MDVTFEPSAARGAALDEQMRLRLADTLDYVFAQIGDAIGADVAAAADVTRRIRHERQSPHMFGAYYEMVLAIEEERIDDARDLAREILTRSSADALHIRAIDDRSAQEAGRYRRMFLDSEIVVNQPEPALLERAMGRIRSAFALLDRGFPEMAGEVRALLSEIVLAAGSIDPKTMTFDGVSAYMLWGAVLLNARGQTNVLDTAQALAHESGHNLLFGYCNSGPLIENDDDELFSSPLRQDPRPMDGVVHATYVTARMHQTVSRLLEAGVLDGEQTEAAEKDLTLHRRNFESGDEVVRSGAKLTPLGHEIMKSARAYIAAAA
jgi:HEXXH motif-containing protein